VLRCEPVGVLMSDPVSAIARKTRVFISYSRADIAFADRFADALVGTIGTNGGMIEPVVMSKSREFDERTGVLFRDCSGVFL
jgi:hypothetical protein